MRPESRPAPYREISEKELLEKIGRINRLNEDINSRLQKMLQKIDSCE